MLLDHAKIQMSFFVLQELCFVVSTFLKVESSLFSSFFMIVFFSAGFALCVCVHILVHVTDSFDAIIIIGIVSVLRIVTRQSSLCLNSINFAIHLITCETPFEYYWGTARSINHVAFGFTNVITVCTYDTRMSL